MTKPLEVRRSPRWAFMEKFVIPNLDGDGIYLTRWRIVQTPWCGLLLHRMDGPDSRETLHDHPWGFVSLVLRGGYVERRLNSLTMDEVDEEHRIRHWNRVRPSDAHAIIRLLRTPTWTLLLAGPRKRVWGYWERAPREWEQPPSIVQGRWCWTRFDRHRHNREFDLAITDLRRDGVVTGVSHAEKS